MENELFKNLTELNNLSTKWNNLQILHDDINKQLWDLFQDKPELLKKFNNELKNFMEEVKQEIINLKGAIENEKK